LSEDKNTQENIRPWEGWSDSAVCGIT